MTSPSCLIELKNILPKTSWPQVILALRQDALIWQALQNPNFRERAIAKLGSHPKKWTPAHLALLSIREDLKPDVLRAASLAELDPELRVRAIQTYEEHSVDSPPKLNLVSAGLLALALQEHFRLTNSWEKIPHTEHWQTTLACLYNLIEQPKSLLLSLPIPLAIHTILANPLSSEEQSKAFTAILISSTNPKRLVLTRALAQQRPNLARSIAHNLWKGNEDAPVEDIAGPNRLIDILPTFENIQNLTDAIKTAAAHAEAQTAGGDNHQSAALLEIAWQTARQLQTILATQTAKVAIRLGDIEKSLANWETAQSPNEIPIEDTAALAFSFIQNGHSKAAQPLLECIDVSSNPVALLARASADYLKGREKAAQEAALQAANNPDQLNKYQIFHLAKLLLDLRQPTEAVHVIEIARQSHPHQLDLALLAAHAYAATGAYPQAIQSIHLATAYEPDQIDIQRDFAQIHEHARHWSAALEARKDIIGTQCDPPAADFRALAECALKLNQYQQAQEACNAAIEINPKDGLAQALLGETYSQLGNALKAKKHLQESIRLAPDQALPWLAMVRFHQRDGNLQDASETLRKAALASPEAAEIHFSLGEDYLQAGSPSQALVSLRKANQLAQTYPPIESFHLQSQIAQPLAKTLFELGHSDEALRTIQSISPLPENQSESLHLQAQILIFSGRAEQAIPLLAKALIENPMNSAINLDYARAQLESKNDPSKAINALLALLENDPENAEALAWLAEALKAKGDSSNALAAYRKALGTRLSEDPNWHPKLSIGLAQSALDLDQPETALAALQRSWQTSPQNLLKITQILASAYTAAHLNDKALQTAYAARDLDPLSLEVLVWFADFACKLQAYDDAAKALSRAIKLEPNQADLRLKLGAIQQIVGNLQDAHQAFLSIMDLDQATPKELRSAAEKLIELELPEDGVICLKIAVGRCQDDPQKSVCTGLILELVDVYLKLGRHLEALAAVDEYIEWQPEKEPVLLGQRAILLNLLGRDDEASAALDHALADYPNSTGLLLAAAQIHYAEGNLPKALEDSQKAIQTLPFDKKTDSSLPTFALAADLADAGLQDPITKEILTYEVDPTDWAGHLDYFCLRSELALQADEEIDAAQALTEALKGSAKHPRVMALQARLAVRHGDGPNAQQILQNALAAWGELPNYEFKSPAGMLGISEAALELQQWSPAIYLLQEVAEKFPQEPRAHLRLARGLVLRAEHQRLCETLQVIRHAPGAAALADFTYQLFEQAILSAAQASEGFGNNSNQVQITHWRIRGQAVFHPSGVHARALGEITQTTESRAALLAALRHSREKQSSKTAALEYYAAATQHLTQNAGNSADLMVQIALALSKQNPRKASNAAQSALNASIRQRHPSQPIFYAVQAFVAEQNGDFETASLALENALSQWSDEPRWHVWAAQSQMGQAEPVAKNLIEHLSKAIELEPKHGAHHLKLGQTYMEAGDLDAAIPALEQAACLLPKQSEPRMALAHAFQAKGDISLIFQNAQLAAELEPKNIDPQILLAESALEINNPEKAIEFSQMALEINPEDPQALILYARALSRTGQSTAALKSFEQALERVPHSVSLMLEHAQLTSLAAGNHSAIEELQDLSNQYPDDPRVLASLAKALINDDQPDPAILAAQKALQTNKGDLDCKQESHLLETLGRLMHRNGQLDHAIHYLSEAIQCNPESISAYLELGRVYQDRRQYQQALDTFQQAIALAPGNANVYYQAGQTLKAAKDYAAAEKMLRNAAKLAPDDIAIRRQLGGLVALNLVHNRRNNVDIYVE